MSPGEHPAAARLHRVHAQHPASRYVDRHGQVSALLRASTLPCTGHTDSNWSTILYDPHGGQKSPDQRPVRPAASSTRTATAADPGRGSAASRIPVRRPRTTKQRPAVRRVQGAHCVRVASGHVHSPGHGGRRGPQPAAQRARPGRGLAPPPRSCRAVPCVMPNVRLVSALRSLAVGSDGGGESRTSVCAGAADRQGPHSREGDCAGHGGKPAARHGRAGTIGRHVEQSVAGHHAQPAGSAEEVVLGVVLAVQPQEFGTSIP